LRAPKRGKARRAPPPAVFARLVGRATLEAHTNDQVVAFVDGYSVDLGTCSAAAWDRVRNIRSGLPLTAFASSAKKIDKEIERLVRRLASQRLLEYGVGPSPLEQVVIEPQIAEYWPTMPRLGADDVLVLSRFAYMHRRGNELVLESPLAGAVFRIGTSKIAAILAALAVPQSVKHLRTLEGFPGDDLLALLVGDQILLKTKLSDPKQPRLVEDDGNLALWEFHDLLFHTRSTAGRHTNPLGAQYPHVDTVPMPRAVRARWPGQGIGLDAPSAAQRDELSPFAELLRSRRSVRSFDDQRPVTLAELATFLHGAARVLSTSTSKVDLGTGVAPEIDYTSRPYPSAGASYELELYLAVERCEGLARGFYHYDAGGHALVPIRTGAQDLQEMLSGARFAMDAPGIPQVLITIAARFGRISWKYSSLAYALILKDVGVTLQTFYLATTDLGLGGCAIGIVDIDLFARITGLELHEEGAVGQFALGRPAKPDNPD